MFIIEIGISYKEGGESAGRGGGHTHFKENSFSGKAPQTGHRTNRLVHEGLGFMNCADTVEASHC